MVSLGEAKFNITINTENVRDQLTVLADCYRDVAERFDEAIKTINEMAEKDINLDENGNEQPEQPQRFVVEGDEEYISVNCVECGLHIGYVVKNGHREWQCYRCSPNEYGQPRAVFEGEESVRYGTKEEERTSVEETQTWQ